jgi:hypothetical protein
MPNLVDDGGELSANLGVPEAQDLIALSSQPLISTIIFLLTSSVLTSVDFDDDAKFDAAEVGEVGADRMLATKLGAENLALAEAGPEQALGESGLITKGSGVKG